MDQLIAQLRIDEAIAAAGTLLLTIPNRLGVTDNAMASTTNLTTSYWHLDGETTPLKGRATDVLRPTPEHQ